MPRTVVNMLFSFHTTVIEKGETTNYCTVHHMICTYKELNQSINQSIIGLGMNESDYSERQRRQDANVSLSALTDSRGRRAVAVTVAVTVIIVITEDSISPFWSNVLLSPLVYARFQFQVSS